MTREELIEEFKNIRSRCILSKDLSKIKATDLLLQYINDPKIDEAYMDIIRLCNL